MAIYDASMWHWVWLRPGKKSEHSNKWHRPYDRNCTVTWSWKFLNVKWAQLHLSITWSYKHSTLISKSTAITFSIYKSCKDRIKRSRTINSWISRVKFRKWRLSVAQLRQQLKNWDFEKDNLLWYKWSKNIPVVLVELIRSNSHKRSKNGCIWFCNHLNFLKNASHGNRHTVNLLLSDRF